MDDLRTESRIGGTGTSSGIGSTGSSSPSSSSGYSGSVSGSNIGSGIGSSSSTGMHSTQYQQRSNEPGMIESQAVKLPTDTFLWAAGASIVCSLSLQLMGRKDDAMFVGQWVPSLLILGLHSRVMKAVGPGGY